MTTTIICFCSPIFNDWVATALVDGKVRYQRRGATAEEARENLERALRKGATR